MRVALAAPQCQQVLDGTGQNFSSAARLHPALPFRPKAYICQMASLPFPHSRCARCQHLRTTENKRGSVFMLCDRNRLDEAFPKYPPQPVSLCAGFEAAE
jgi:hypothetical protein